MESIIAFEMGFLIVHDRRNIKIEYFSLLRLLFARIAIESIVELSHDTAISIKKNPVVEILYVHLAGGRTFQKAPIGFICRESVSYMTHLANPFIFSK